jgi:aspartate-semialdehyde dehydrogenase
MKVAVLGATGLVGAEMLKVLEERAFPAEEILPLASPRSAWRMDPQVPLVVPEVNPEDVKWHSGIIANPNCATIQAVTALKPLHDAAGLEAVWVVTFQSVSGTGRPGLDALAEGSSAALGGRSADAGPYPRPIAFDVMPEIGGIGPDGISGEERKMILESRKILHIPDLDVHCTAVRVPVFRGHAEAVTARFRKPLDAQAACRLLDGAAGVVCCEARQEGCYATPREAVGRDGVFIGRVRSEGRAAKEISFWVTADNLRKGAALNAVQIADIL